MRRGELINLTTLEWLQMEVPIAKLTGIEITNDKKERERNGISIDGNVDEWQLIILIILKAF